MGDESKQPIDELIAARKCIWRQRRRRFATGLNVCVSIVLAAILLVLVNYLSNRYYMHWDLSGSGYYKLSDKTCSLLASLKGDYCVVSFFRQSHELSDEIRNLLKEFKYEARKNSNLNLMVEIVDPDRDLERVKELKQKYDLTQPNCIVFESEGRTKYIEAADIVDYEVRISQYGVSQKMVAFKGEQVISSAIQSISQIKKPVVYFLKGHGERDVDDYGKNSGYSSLARIMSHDNIEARSFVLAAHGGVPKDCNALVIAGPDRKFSRDEIDMLSKYLERNGRIFFLLDPAVNVGLDDLMKNWGVRLCSGTAVGLTSTGRELWVERFGDHPITKNLKNITVMFYMPRGVEPLAAPETANIVQVDKPRVSVLASNTEDGWLETNLNQNPPKYEPGIDMPGPISVAVAVEKGSIGGIEVELRPTRMVVVGDSYFVANGPLKTGIGGNVDFFMSALNWLLEREALMAIAPKIPGELHLALSGKQRRTVYFIITGGAPGIAAFMGILVLWRRRK